MSKTYQYVNNLWNEAEAAKLAGVDRLVYRSNKLGSDQRITNTGGGNTSSKISETDPLMGEKVEVLWVKGSGGDLRTSLRENFSSLYQSKLLGLQKGYAARADKGLKSQAEDDMVAAYNHTTFNLNPRASSIDTPLHSFIPAKFVDHMHPNSVISVAASRRSADLTREIFGEDVVWTPWLRPGFELGLELQRVVEAISGVRLHKQNFRRLIEAQGLVEGTGKFASQSRGRPAELFRFRREVLAERPVAGVRLTTRLRSTR